MELNKTDRKSLALGLYERNDNVYSKRQLSEALEISESSMYYKGVQGSKDLIIKNEIEELHKLDDTLGSRKLSVLLKRSRGSVSRVMLKYNIETRMQKKKYNYTGKSNDIVPNKLLEIENLQDYEVVFSDIFEFKLSGGKKVYCCFMMRKNTRQILSFSYAYHMRGDLVSESINHIDLTGELGKADVIFHSDQGSQYGSEVTIQQILNYQFERSMSRAGTPTDNGYAERFVGIFKHSVVDRYVYKRLEGFAEEATRWLNFYNRRRPHGSLGQQSPNEFARSKGLKSVSYLALNLL